MLRILILTLLALGSTSVLGKPGQGRIVGGENALPNEFKSLVEIRQAGGHFCAGTILDEEWVVTAAQCASSRPNDYTVVAGEHNINIDEGTEQTRQVFRIVVHDDYQQPPANLANDIALLYVSPPFEFNDYVQPGVFAGSGTAPSANGTVVGWGTTSQAGGNPTVLQKANIPIISDQACRDIYGQDTVADNMLCAGEPGKDACFGDSGGPLYCDADNGTTEVCGLVSWGSGCAVYPSVYTEVSFFENWLEEYAGPPVEDNSTWVAVDGCGGLLVGSSGRITHQPEGGLRAGERCTWTIRANALSSVRIEGIDSDFGPGDGLTVTEVNYDQGVPSRTLPLTTTAIFEGPIIFVTLTVGDQDPGSGFTLVFQGMGFPDERELYYDNNHLEDSAGSFSYPVGGGTYRADELSTVVLNPAGATLASLTITRLDLEASGTCGFDKLTVLGHNTGGQPAFVSLGAYCGSSAPPGVITNNDGVILLILRTDYSIQYSGFAISWTSS